MRTKDKTSNYHIFMRSLKAADKRHRRFFPVLVIFMAGVGLFESLTLAWVAGFASWMASPDSVMNTSLFQVIIRILPGIAEVTDRQFVIGGSLLLAALVLVKNILRACSRYITTRYSTSIRARIGYTLMSQILFRPYVWYLDKKSAELQQLLNWSTHIGEFLQDILRIMTNIIIVTFMMATLFLYGTAITIPVILLVSVLSVVIFKALRRHIDRMSEKQQEIQVKAFRSAAYTIRAYKDVRIENVERTFLSSYRAALRSLIRTSSLRGLLGITPSLLLEFLGFLSLTMMIVIMVLRNDVDAGTTLSYMAILAVVAWRVIPAVNNILKAVAKVRGSVPFIVSVLDFLDEDITLDETAYPGLEPLHLEEGLQIRNVRFKYPTSESDVIKGITLDVKKGEKIGIIGSSGCGKTTLIDLLAGLLSPESGEIAVDGTVLSGMDLKRWQVAIGYMPQSPFIIPGTLADNVAFGIPEEKRDMAKINDSLTKASLTEARWNPDAILTETGRNLSGGQAQRMTLARMFYKDSDVLIIDEGTSSLDPDTESQILDDLFLETNDKTIILITHRRDSLHRCGRIISIEEGQVVADGRPEEILRKKSG